MLRLDITYAVHVLSRFMHQPRKAHMEAALRVVRYLKNAPADGMFFYSNNDFRLRAYCDSDWAEKVHYMLLCIPWAFTDFLEIKATENSVTLFSRSKILFNDKSLL